MDIIDSLISNLYEQSFYNGTMINPTRFFILHYIASNETLRAKYSLLEIFYYVYCLYSDNPEIAHRHPNIEIRNILKYGSTPIKQEVIQAIKNWIDDSSRSVILLEGNNLIINMDETNYSDDLSYLKIVIEQHFKNTYHVNFPKFMPITGSDLDIHSFGKGPYRNRVLYDMQYCVCCDEYRLDKLSAVHILNDNESPLKESREDRNNGVILCDIHAEEYLHNRFKFNEKGKIINISSSFIQRHMRISDKLLNSKRLEYFKINSQKKE